MEEVTKSKAWIDVGKRVRSLVGAERSQRKSQAVVSFQELTRETTLMMTVIRVGR